MRARRVFWAFSLVGVLGVVSSGTIGAAGSQPVLRVTIAPDSGNVEFSVIRKGVAMEHGRTTKSISRMVAKDESLALVVHAETGEEVSVTITEGPQDVPHASARGENVSATVVAGRASVLAF